MKRKYQLINLWNAVSALLESKHSTSSQEHVALLDGVRLAHSHCENAERSLFADARYEYIRKLNVQQYAELSNRHLIGSLTFDELVDAEIESALNAKQ